MAAPCGVLCLPPPAIRFCRLDAVAVAPCVVFALGFRAGRCFKLWQVRWELKGLENLTVKRITAHWQCLILLRRYP